MKRLLLAALALIASCSFSFAQIHYTINGKVDGAKGTAYLTDDHNDIIDSCVVNNGEFTFKGTVATPVIYYVSCGTSRADAYNERIFIEDGTINVSGTPGMSGKRSSSGTPLNEAYSEYINKYEAIYEHSRDTSLTTAQRERIYNSGDSLKSTVAASNQGNYLGFYFLSRDYYEMDPQTVIDSLAKYPTYIQECGTAKDMKASCEKKLTVAVGKNYIEIELPDPDGKVIKLSDVIAKNKYTLVDFFASWCGPCMQEVPNLVEAYSQYHKKGFEIYGVSLDYKAENWKKCIVNKKLTWINVSDVKGWKCAPAQDYAVNAVPSNFLLDSNGKIIALNLRGEDLAAKLAELLK